MSKPKIKPVVETLSPKDRKAVTSGTDAEFKEVLDRVSPSVKATSKSSKALAVILPESKPEQVEQLLTAFAVAEEVHGRLRLVFQAAQGACLHRLKAERGHHNASRHSASCGVAWEEYIKTKWGFSDDSAARRMKVWDGMRTKIEALPP